MKKYSRRCCCGLRNRHDVYRFAGAEAAEIPIGGTVAVSGQGPVELWLQWVQS
ncbi:MAG TPA: hypothetical protein VJN71_02650 [Nitrososphaerales archaeon]|nr:hypothetical protein [Nitrososphaerales archaeon]